MRHLIHEASCLLVSLGGIASMFLYVFTDETDYMIIGLLAVIAAILLRGPYRPGGHP